MVYIVPENSWHSPCSCLWTSTPRIGKHFGISHIYADLKTLFVNRLSIEAPTISTYADQLKDLVSSAGPSINGIKDAIKSINQLSPGEDDLDDLRNLKWLPIKSRYGETVLGDISEAFFIVDRVEYGNAFRNKVSVLDFSLEEVWSLQPFLWSLGLQNRYMSSAISESTDVRQPSKEPATNLTHDFREKATALFR